MITPTSSRYSLPADARTRQIWINRIGNPKLVGIEDMSILHNYVVCRNHFADKCVNPNGRLIKLALPTLNLFAYDESTSIQNESCFLSPKQSCYQTPKKIQDMLQMLTSTSTSLSPPKTKMSVQIPINVYEKGIFRIHSVDKRELATTEDVNPSSSRTSKTLGDEEMHLPLNEADLIPKHIVEVTQSDKEKQTLCYDCGRSRIRGELQRVGVTRVRHLSKDAQILYKRLYELKKIAARFCYVKLCVIDGGTDLKTMLNHFRAYAVSNLPST